MEWDFFFLFTLNGFCVCELYERNVCMLCLLKYVKEEVNVVSRLLFSVKKEIYIHYIWQYNREGSINTIFVLLAAYYYKDQCGIYGIKRDGTSFFFILENQAPYFIIIIHKVHVIPCVLFIFYTTEKKNIIL